jgi:23S rRNA pseudoU1915 N3-methylase RlmH
MDKDEQSQGRQKPNVIALAQRGKQMPTRHWVQATPGLQTREVLEEASVILGCVTGLTQQALAKPREAQTLMRATFYLSGLARVMIEGQLPSIKEQGEISLDR